MKRILKCLREYKRDFILTPVLVALEAVCELMLIVVIGRFIDQLAAATTMGVIVRYGAILLLLAALAFALGVASGMVSVHGAAGLAKNLRNTLFARFQEFSFENIDRFSTDSPR